jgi:CHAT domain-containing protein
MKSRFLLSVLFVFFMGLSPVYAQNGSHEELVDSVFMCGLECRAHPQEIASFDIDRALASKDTVVTLALLEALCGVSPASVDEPLLTTYYIPYLKRTITELAASKAELRSLAHGRPLSLHPHYDINLAGYGVPENRYDQVYWFYLGKVLKDHFMARKQEEGRSEQYRFYHPLPALHYLEAALYGDDTYTRALPGEAMSEKEKTALKRFAGCSSDADYFTIVQAVDQKVVQIMNRRGPAYIRSHTADFEGYYDKYRPGGAYQLGITFAFLVADQPSWNNYSGWQSLTSPEIQVELDYVSTLRRQLQLNSELIRKKISEWPDPASCWMEHQDNPEFREYYHAFVLLELTILKGFLLVSDQDERLGGYFVTQMEEGFKEMGYSEFREMAVESVGTATEYWSFTKDPLGIELMEMAVSVCDRLNYVHAGYFTDAAFVYLQLGMRMPALWLLEAYILPVFDTHLTWEDDTPEEDFRGELYTVLRVMNLMALVDREGYGSSLSELETWFDERFPRVTDRFWRTTLALNYANYLESAGKYARSLSLLSSPDLTGTQEQWSVDMLSFMDWYGLGDFRKAADYIGCFQDQDLSAWDFDVLGKVVDVGARSADPLVPEYGAAFYDRMQWLLQSNFLTARDEDRTDMAETLWKSALPLVRTMGILPVGSDERKLLSGLLYDWSLLSKGLLLEAGQSMAKALQNAPEEHIRSLYGMLKYWTRTYDNNLMNGASQEDLSFCINAYGYYQRFIQTYMRSNPLLKEFADHISIRWTDVQRRLGPAEAAVEFVAYDQDGEQRYVALVMRNAGGPEAVSLCSEAEVRSIMRRLAENRLYSNAFASKQLYGLVWKPLEAYLEGVQDVYFAADGLFHQMNLEALQDGSGQLACARWNLYRVSSTRELCKDFRHRSPMRKAVLYGGLDYALEGALAPEIEARYADMHSSGTRGTMVPGQVPVTSLSAETLPEVESIRASLAPAGVDSRILTGADGMEESFKQLSGTGVNLIHMATHGFFFDGIVEYQGNKEEVLPPMLRSGLVMSRFPEPKDGFEDGYLLASEIAELDLSSVGLFVMSACETGKGDVSGEGVFGLQRGLKQAGVGSIIMTLWKVNSEVAQRFMTTFYSCLGRGADRYAAFREARSETRKAFPTSDWSAFILLD